MKKRVKHKCTKCGEWKPAPEPGTSYFTEFRGWFCDDCKYDRAVDNGNIEMSTIIRLMESK